MASRFEQVAATYPDRPAVEHNAAVWSYRRLRRDADRAARLISASTLDPTAPVLLLLDDPVVSIAAMLGSLKCGIPYVPLDPSGPKLRLARVVADSKARLLVATPSTRALAGELAGSDIPVASLDDTTDPPARDHHAPPRPTPNTSAWILYTSGSTGRPKGVLQTHRNVTHYVKVYTEGYDITPSDRIALLYSLTTNAGNHELLSGLLNGACVLPFNPRHRGAAELARWLVSEHVTIYSSVPTLFRQLVSTLDGAITFADLRVVKMVGEPVYRSDFDAYRRCCPRSCVFINRLGSTETGTVCWQFLNHDGDSHLDGPNVPVGHAAADDEVPVVDDLHQPVPAGVVGEIVVNSRYLSPGYWRDPDATAAAFQADDERETRRTFLTGDLGKMLPDGRLLHMGRRDDQVKINGYRVELPEVQQALLALPGVKEAVVVPRTQEHGPRRLVAYLVPHDPDAFSVSVVRRELEARLPPYMIPAAFVPLASFPLAPNGKIQRSALPAPSRERPALDAQFREPQTAVEHEVAAVWRAVLDVTEVGLDDPFLELGGDSVHAGQIASRLQRRFDVEIPLGRFLEAGTVASMAQTIQQAGRTSL